jgi:hypothetical protein
MRGFGLNRQRLSSPLQGLGRLTDAAMDKLERKLAEWWKKPAGRVLIIIVVCIIFLYIYWIIAQSPDPPAPVG